MVVFHGNNHHSSRASSSAADSATIPSISSVIDVTRGFKAEMSRIFQLSTKPEYKRRKMPARADPVARVPRELRCATELCLLVSL